MSDDVRDPRALCDACSRPEGACIDRDWQPDGEPIGPMTVCGLCGKSVCSDCLHENECCFEGADDHRGEPDWAPKGWRKVTRLVPEYRRRAKGGLAVFVGEAVETEVIYERI